MSIKRIVHLRRRISCVFLCNCAYIYERFFSFLNLGGLILFPAKQNCTGLWHCYHHPEAKATVAVHATVGSRPHYQRNNSSTLGHGFPYTTKAPPKNYMQTWEIVPEKEVWRCPNTSLSMPALVHMLSAARHGVILTNMLVVMKFIVKTGNA